MKHAYLILAHNEYGILQKLVSCLDDARNDIYVHIDKKVKELPQLEVKNASLTMLEDRVDVRWGDLSVVKAEYKLFEAAAAKDNYEYYHLISGVDLPLKSQDQIHKFFQMNRGKEFIGYSNYDTTAELHRKVNLWHLFPGDFKNTSRIKQILRAGFIRFQEAFHLYRNTKETFRKGTQWVSLTDDFVRHMIAAKPWVMKTFSHTFCPDEIYKQTLCWVSGYRQRIYDYTDEANGCQRAIGWENNAIREWTMADYERLMSSGMLFARKFSSKNFDIINKLCKTQTNDKLNNRLENETIRSDLGNEISSDSACGIWPRSAFYNGPCRGGFLLDGDLSFHIRNDITQPSKG